MMFLPEGEVFYTALLYIGIFFGVIRHFLVPFESIDAVRQGV